MPTSHMAKNPEGEGVKRTCGLVGDLIEDYLLVVPPKQNPQRHTQTRDHLPYLEHHRAALHSRGRFGVRRYVWLTLSSPATVIAFGASVCACVCMVCVCKPRGIYFVFWLLLLAPPERETVETSISKNPSIRTLFQPVALLPGAFQARGGAYTQ